MSKQVICESLQALKDQNPLVLNLTNYVVMNNTANALLAIGASPIMAHSKQEMTEMVSFSGALVINIGTLDSNWIDCMSFAIDQANQYNKTVVLDPVGCGATKLRLATAQQFSKQAKNLIIRGNASEIIALAGQNSQAKGVDSLDDSKNAIRTASYLVEHYGANVVVSGVCDYVVTATKVFELSNGDAMMPFVTGMGCTLTALTGAFAAIGDKTGLSATALLGVAGEISAQQSKGPASLQMNLIDTLYSLDQATLLKHLKLKEITNES